MADNENLSPTTGGVLTAKFQDHTVHAMATGNGFNRSFLASATPGGSPIDAYQSSTEAVGCDGCGSDLD